MRKICYLVFWAAVASVYAAAKTTVTVIPSIIPHYGSGANANSIGYNASRLISAAYYKYDGNGFQPVDSTVYNYAFGRGGQLSEEEMLDHFVNFEESYTYVFNAGTSAFENRLQRLQEFNSLNQPIKYTVKIWDTTVASWKDSSRFIYTYNIHQNKLEKTWFQIYTGFWTNHVFYDNFYDAANRLIRTKSNVLRMSFSYDGNGNVTEREDSVWFAGSGWTKYEKSVFNYDASGRLLDHTGLIFSNNAWQNVFKEDYSFSGSKKTQRIRYVWQNNQWEVNGRNLYRYDTAQNLIEDEWQYWDAGSASFKSYSRERWIYNSYHQPLLYFSESFDLSAQLWNSGKDDFLYRYIYQPYSPTGVKNLSKNNLKLKVYPLPADKILTIRFENPRAERFLISVFDFEGRLMKQTDELITEDWELDTSGFPAGIYFIRLHSKNTQQSTRFTVRH